MYWSHRAVVFYWISEGGDGSYQTWSTRQRHHNTQSYCLKPIPVQPSSTESFLPTLRGHSFPLHFQDLLLKWDLCLAQWQGVCHLFFLPGWDCHKTLTILNQRVGFIKMQNKWECSHKLWSVIEAIMPPNLMSYSSSKSETENLRSIKI